MNTRGGAGSPSNNGDKGGEGNGQAEDAGGRRWLLLAVLMLGVTGLSTAVLMGRSAGASVEGKVRGRAATLEYVSGEAITGLNGLGFPPGGTLKKALASNELGGALSITSTTAQVDCGGNSTGTDSVNARCSSQEKPALERNMACAELGETSEKAGKAREAIQWYRLGCNAFELPTTNCIRLKMLDR